MSNLKTPDKLVHVREPYPSSSHGGVVTYFAACGVHVYGPSPWAAKRKKNRRKLRDPRTTETVTCMVCLAD